MPIRLAAVLLYLLSVLALIACDGGDEDAAIENPNPAAPETPSASASAAIAPPAPTANPEDPTSTPEPGPATQDPPAPPDPPQGLQLAPAFGGARLEQPLDMDPIPGSPGRYLVLDQSGLLFVLDEAGGEPAPAGDLSGQVNTGFEQGLLSATFSPHYAEDATVYLYYTTDGPRRSVLSSFRFDGQQIDPASEQVILEVEQPFTNHNGGGMAFGPDGMLYLGFGDGGGAADPEQNGQNVGTLLATIIRIDVEPGGYSVPPDNPFLATEGARGEIYAYGLRNPWRFSFDRETGDLWLADVGQDGWEEINRIELGGNYGWSVMEGPDCFRADECNREGLITPVYAYTHAEGCSVTGGYVYRGSEFPALQGWYLFSDFCSGVIWALSTADPSRVVRLVDQGPQVTAFGETEEGEIYVLAFGGIYRLSLP